MIEPLSTFFGLTILGAMVALPVTAGLDATVIAQVKSLMEDTRKARAFNTALTTAADKFRVQHPNLAEQYFGEEFLKEPKVLKELMKLLATTEKISIQPIVEVAWQSSDPAPEAVIQAAENFISALRSAIAAQEVLASDYDRRLLTETYENVAATNETVVCIAEELRQIRTQLHSPDEKHTSNPEVPTFTESAVREAFGMASSFLLRWPREIGGRWFDRPELATLKNTILSKPHSISVVLGAPGCGKSALLAHLGNELCVQDVALLALKVDEMPRDVKSAADISEWLDTPGPVEQCVQQIADSHLVVLLVDQLDAVGELIDVHTNRLTALLSLVNRVQATPNVHIVLSCRQFDYDYDVRFSSLNAEVVNLDDLPWGSVEEVLGDRGINASSWSEPARRVLCTPQHLRLFIDHLADSVNIPAFNSYHSMLEAVFTLRFKGPDAQSLVNSLGSVALQMAESEELWQPRARFDDQFKTIEKLIGLGLLQLSSNKKQITFTHQTVFDFTRARAFVHTEYSLADYVASKQGSLNIRPTLWSALHYLRSADPQTYRQQLKQVWEIAGLRLHVRLLLISFLGQLSNPDMNEAKLLLPAIDDVRLREKVLLALGNSPGWFEKLTSRLPALMTGEKSDATLIARLLSQAINFDRETVLGLVKKYWLPQKKFDAITLHVFRDLEDWDGCASAIVEIVVGRSPNQSIWVGIIAEKALKTAPECSARIVRDTLDRALRDEEAKNPQEPIPPPDGAPVDQLVAYQIEQSEIRYERFERVLENHSDWYNLPNWATRHPKEFLTELWPLFLRFIEHLKYDPDNSVVSYVDCHSLAFDVSSETVDQAPVPSALQAAVIGYAEQAPNEFLEFLRKHQESNLKPVHTLLAQGLKKIANSHPTDCLTYLLEDPRRLALGPFNHRHRDSIALISALYPYLDTDQRAKVDAAILEFTYRIVDPSGSDAATRRDRIRWNKQNRLRLLRAIPRDLMSDSTRRSYEELERAFPLTRDENVELMHGIGAIDSPMSTEQMSKAGDDDLLRLFNELTDETEWDNPKDWMRGGSVQASRAFEGLAKLDPDRALNLFERFEPGRHERPVGYALRGLMAEMVLPPEKLVNIIRNLNSRGFISQEFRVEAARCLRSAAFKLKGLPDKTCEMLEGWLTPWAPLDDVHDNEPAENNPNALMNEDDKEESVIWGNKHSEILPNENYPVLEAIEKGYLCRSPQAINPWLDVLERRLDCPENPEVWRALAPNLWLVLSDDPARASTFLGRLFDEVPSILQCRAGIILLANVRWWLPKTVMWRAMEVVLAGPWGQGARAVGEILFLYWVINPEDTDFKRFMEDVVVGRESRYIADDNQRRLLRLGVATSAANVWNVPKFRELSSYTLGRLFLLKDNGLPKVIMDVFRATDQMPEDEHTQRLLQTLPIYPECLRHRSFSLMKHLKAMLANGAFVEEICTVAETVVAVVGREIRDMTTHWASHAEDLIQIAITLQRFEETRDRGLKLFEDLMGFERIHLPKLLREIDRRVDG